MLAPTPRRWVSLQTRLTAMSAFLVLLAAGGVTYLFHRLSVESVSRRRVLAASDVAEATPPGLPAGLPPRAILDSVLSEYVHANSEVVATSVLVRTEEG